MKQAQTMHTNFAARSGEKRRSAGSRAAVAAVLHGLLRSRALQAVRVLRRYRAFVAAPEHPILAGADTAATESLEKDRA